MRLRGNCNPHIKSRDVLPWIPDCPDIRHWGPDGFEVNTEEYKFKTDAQWAAAFRHYLKSGVGFYRRIPSLKGKDQGKDKKGKGKKE